MSTERTPFRPTGAKTLTALASLAASVATVLALFVVPGDNGPGSAQASPPSVARVCRVTQKGWDDQVRREPAFRAAVGHARTPPAARDAIVNETQARIASSGAAMSSLRAVRSPGGEAGARYALALRAWSRNVARLERYRDALSGASTFAAIDSAAVANNQERSAFENDAHTVMAGLQALGGDACELDPPPPTPVTHLKKGPATTKPDAAPGAAPLRPDVTPPAATPNTAPGDASPDVTPGSDPDVSPDASPETEPADPDVNPNVVPPSPPDTEPAPDAEPTPEAEPAPDSAAQDGGSTP